MAPSKQETLFCQTIYRRSAWLLEGTGLSYYGYRFYQPVMGRWLTRDPLQEAGGINLYGFVQNNPVNWIDPWGLDSSSGSWTFWQSINYLNNQAQARYQPGYVPPPPDPNAISKNDILSELNDIVNSIPPGERTGLWWIDGPLMGKQLADFINDAINEQRQKKEPPKKPCH